MNKAEAMRAYLDELDKRVKLDKELRKLKAEKRDMWEAMSEACHNYSPLSKACYGHVAKTQPCSMASCPLLNPKVKE